MFSPARPLCLLFALALGFAPLAPPFHVHATESAAHGRVPFHGTASAKADTVPHDHGHPHETALTDGHAADCCAARAADPGIHVHETLPVLRRSRALLLRASIRLASTVPPALAAAPVFAPSAVPLLFRVEREPDPPRPRGSMRPVFSGLSPPLSSRIA